MELEYHVVDVFTTTPLEGNPLAVFPDATGLDTNTMQRIAREFNLSETTFILPAQSRADATRVRIFTPGAEMEFAGHPTIGTAYVMRRLNLVSPQAATFTLDENIGPVNVRVDAGEDPILWLTMPEIREAGEIPRSLCARAVSLSENDLLPTLPCEVLSAGNPTLFIPLKDAASVDRASVDTAALTIAQQQCAAPCVFVFAPTSAGAYSRMFARDLGVSEDPATGSATGPLATYMMKHGLVARADGTRFVSEQGYKMGRPSVLHVLVHGSGGEAGREVGGNVAYVATGRLSLPSLASERQPDVSICR
jgi:trans-2,3-dihydro-3-hydroxyanthranilate isomerase